jgi:hypothetical protein
MELRRTIASKIRQKSLVILFCTVTLRKSLMRFEIYVLLTSSEVRTSSVCLCMPLLCLIPSPKINERLRANRVNIDRYLVVRLNKRLAKLVPSAAAVQSAFKPPNG